MTRVVAGLRGRELGRNTRIGWERRTKREILFRQRGKWLRLLDSHQRKFSLLGSKVIEVLSFQRSCLLTGTEASILKIQ